MESEGFRASCTLNKDNLVEASEGAGGKFREILWLVLLGVFALGVVLLLIIDHTPAAWALLLVCIAGALFCAYMRFVQPASRAKRMHALLSELCKKETFPLFLDFGEKTFRCDLPTGGSFEMEYKKLRSAVRTEKLIVLITKQNLLLPMETSKIVGGTESDFLLFLLERCKKLRMEGFDYTEE